MNTNNKVIRKRNRKVTTPNNSTPKATTKGSTVFQNGQWILVTESHNSSSSQLAADAAIYWANTEVNETIEDHIVPRRSITSSQHLGLFAPVVISSIEIKSQQAEKIGDKLTGRMINTSDIRVLKMSDKTLLNRGVAFQMPDSIKRETSKTHRIKHDQDTEFKNQPKE